MYYLLGSYECLVILECLADLRLAAELGLVNPPLEAVNDDGGASAAAEADLCCK